MKVNKKLMIPVLIILVIVSTVGGTLAYLADDSEAVVNTFTPATIKVTIEEDFDGSRKENVAVTNDGTADAYMRVKLIAYWQNKTDGTIVAKDSWFEMAEKTPDNGWFYADGFYYYPEIVKTTGTEKTTAVLFNDPIELLTDSESGTSQVLEIHAEAIQAVPITAVTEAWTAVKVVDGKLVQK